jgi:hypothetical protein
VSHAIRIKRGDRVLGHLLSQKGDDVLEVAREPRPACPRHRLHAHAAIRALHAPQRGHQIATLGTKVEVAPAAPHRVVAGAADLPAARAHPPAATQPHLDHDAFGSKRTPMTDAPRRLSVRLNAVVARTSSSLKSR